VGVGVTHASFAAEVQSEIPQVVRIIGFFPLAPSPQPQETESQEARHLVKALGGGHPDGAEAVRHGRRSKKTVREVHLSTKIASDQNKSSNNKHLAK
jgi:hypothetical protein